MEEIKIEKGVPMPIRKKGQSKYPFDKMEVGDSIFIKDCQPNSMYQIAMIWRKQSKVQWRFKAVKEVEGTRLWRME